jgi:hypothetical protein
VFVDVAHAAVFAATSTFDPLLPALKDMGVAGQLFTFDIEVGRCSLTLSNPVLKAPAAYAFSICHYHMMKCFRLLLATQVAALHGGARRVRQLLHVG